MARIAKNTHPAVHTDTRQALRDALLVAIVQAEMARRPLWSLSVVAAEGHQFVALADSLALRAYPED